MYTIPTMARRSHWQSATCGATKPTLAGAPSSRPTASSCCTSGLPTAKGVVSRSLAPRCDHEVSQRSSLASDEQAVELEQDRQHAATQPVRRGRSWAPRHDPLEDGPMKERRDRKAPRLADDDLEARPRHPALQLRSGIAPHMTRPHVGAREPRGIPWHRDGEDSPTTQNARSLRESGEIVLQVLEDLPQHEGVERRGRKGERCRVAACDP